MSKRKVTDDSSLFDDMVEEEVGEVPCSWNEVPQALFLSWSTARQLAYCAARDESAVADEYATTLKEAEWFMNRAAGYRKDMEIA